MPAIVVASLVGARAARAQWTLSADLGGAHLRQTGIQESNAATVGAAADFSAEHGSLHTNVLGARAGAGRWTGQALVIGSVAGPIGRTMQWELVPVGGLFAETSARTTWSDELIARLRVGSGARGFAAGAGAGMTSLGSATNGLYLAEADGWQTTGAEQLAASASVVSTRSTLFAQSAPVSVRYADLAASWHHEAGSWSVGASAGARHGWSGAPRNDQWGSVDATAWLGDRAALVFGGGQTLEDVTRGVPRSKYVSLALRISTGKHPRVFDRERRAGPQLVVSGSAGETREFVVIARAAQTVELMADFTDWQPVSLVRGENDHWRVERAVTPGLHRIALRIDGGPWVVPGNLPRASDDLGGAVGLLTVP